MLEICAAEAKKSGMLVSRMVEASITTRCFISQNAMDLNHC